MSFFSKSKATVAPVLEREPSDLERFHATTAEVLDLDAALANVRRQMAEWRLANDDTRVVTLVSREGIVKSLALNALFTRNGLTDLEQREREIVMLFYSKLDERAILLERLRAQGVPVE